MENDEVNEIENELVTEEQSELQEETSEPVIILRKTVHGGGFNVMREKIKRFCLAALKKLKKAANLVFIDGMTGMALGLFATLIIGTIIAQIGKYVGDNFVGVVLTQVGGTAKALMGAGIGAGVACKFKKSPILVVSVAVAGMIGAQAGAIIDIAKGSEVTALIFSGTKVGEPVGAFVAAMVAMSVGGLVSGKTKLDIVLTPLVAILSGAIAGLLVGPPISAFMNTLGKTIEWGMAQNQIIMGIVVAVLMGIALTAPISSAALGISLNLTGLAAGAATVGCCCQMIGFAVSSFRENKVGGLIAQGVGTSMLQMPNIIKKPIIWLPSIIASAILGPIASGALGMVSNAIGSGMGTAGLVGPLMAFETMTEAGTSALTTLVQIGLMYFILPAAICLAITELMRKLKLINFGDMKLEIN